MQVMMNAKTMKAAVLENLHHPDRHKNLMRSVVIMRSENKDHMAEIILHGNKVHL
ncbi:MAG: hypothetical protein MK132_10665 [Lentisphaerales bacterium]|nr:hypothetical protein [Lentisphaerales bacterium]